MPLNVWFTPTNPAHMGKFMPLMRCLRERGDQPTLFSVGAVPLAASECESADFRFLQLPPCGFKGSRNHFRSALGLGRLARAMETTLVQHRHEIDVVVLGGDTWVFSRTLIRTARRLGIPTVLLVDGLQLPPNPCYRLSLWRRIKSTLGSWIDLLVGSIGPRGSGGSDLILVIDEMSRQLLIEEGIKPARLRVVGSPAFDQMASRARPLTPDEERDWRHRLGIPQHRSVIAFMQQPVFDPPTVQHELLTSMIQACRACEAMLVVKFHPRSRENTADWRRWANEQGFGDSSVAFFTSECTAEDLARIAGACVTVFSTAVMDAFIYGKPVVIIRYLNVPYELRYGSQYAAAIDVHSPADFQQAFAAALHDDQVRDRLQRQVRFVLDKYFFGLDGRSADRVRNALMEIVQHKKDDVSRAGTRSIRRR